MSPPIGQSSMHSENASKIVPQFDSRESLPVWSYRQQIINAVDSNDVVIISGETGSGKTTQIPQYLHSHYKRVAVTQPRRVAAVSVAGRVAKEMGESSVGGVVGYKVRFEDSTSEKTRIKFLTDGMLLRESVLDNGKFSKYDVVIVDEVHERSLHTDVLLGLLHNRLAESVSTTSLPGDSSTKKANKKLKVVLMSATVAVETFATFFKNCGKVSDLRIPGRLHPVDIFYTKEVELDYVEATVIAVLQIHVTRRDGGDILVFLPGQEDIESVQASLDARRPQLAKLPPDVPNMEIVPMYASLSHELQMAAFSKTSNGTRKIVLATNIAETSVTIPGIQFVIDCGIVKLRTTASGGSGLEVLQVTEASKASVMQRAGRAGREGPGECYRLFRECDYESLLPETTPPEITRCDLSSAILQIYAMGVLKGETPSLLNFPLVDKPSNAAILRAERTLKRLNALNASLGITDYGRQMAALPVVPLLANLLLQSVSMGCVAEVLTVVALLSSDNLMRLRDRPKIQNQFGDLWNLISIYRQWNKCDKFEERISICKSNGINENSMKKAFQIRKELKFYLQKQKNSLLEIDSNTTCGNDPTILSKAIGKGLWMNVATLVENDRYETLEKLECYIHPSSTLFGLKPKCVVFVEIVQTTRNYLRWVTPIDGNWLIELVPQFFAVAQQQSGSQPRTD